MARHLRVGPAVHRLEKEAIDFLVQNLPAGCLVYSNVELATGRPGQTFEHDAIVVTPLAVFTVEIKSWGGTIRGNRDRWTLADGTQWHSPIPPTQSKARVLKSRLKARRADLDRVWVQGLIFLSAADADPHISADYADLVTTRRDVIQALADPDWFHLREPIRPGQLHAIEMFLADGRPRQIANTLGSFELIEQLDAEDRPYEAWVGKEPIGGQHHVLHVHTLAAEDAEQREALRHHAYREATLHQRLRGGPHILRYDTYFLTEDPQRVVLQFENTTPLLPLPAWVEVYQPGLATRLQVAHKVAQAVAWVHARKVVLRGLTPESVLVSPEESPTDVRLCAFDLARDTSTGTATLVGGSSLTALRTSAPEVLKSGIADELSDLFSLGVTLYELFAGRCLFDSVDAILQPFTIPPIDVAGRRLPADVHGLIVRLLNVAGTQRPKADEVVETLADALYHQSRRPISSELVPGAEIRATYELEARLGRGATATTWRARHLQTGQTRVLKIGGPESAEMLALECRILTEVHHANLVRAYEVGPDGDRQVLVLEHVDGMTGRLVISAGDPPVPEAFRTAARGLLQAVDALHRGGWLHRDIKPDNLLFRSDVTLEPVLLDLGLAVRTETTGDLTVGTPTYKDPLVYREGRWTRANDVYAVMLVLAELVTGAHPFGNRAPDEDTAPEIAVEEVSEHFPPQVADAVVAVLRLSLAPTREGRPRDALDALARLEQALGLASRAPTVPVAAFAVPSADVSPSTPVNDLPLSTRAQGALARMQVRTAAQLAGLDARAARRLPTVGAKTVRELERWANDLRRRWPDTAPAPAGEPELYPSLRLDERPLTALGNALSEHTCALLRERGLRTIGHLATSTESVLLALPRFGPTKLAALRDALARLAGSHAPPASLRLLDARLQEELGRNTHAYLASVVGLHDGAARSLSQVAEQFGVSRQRVDQAVDLTPLRAPASEAAALLRLIHDVLPPAGFAPIGFVEGAIRERLGAEPGVSCRGYAVLAALLLDPSRRASQAAAVDFVLAPPWTPEQVVEACSRLSEATRWPYRRETAERETWDALPDLIRTSLVRRGCDASQVLAALLRLVDDIKVDPYGALYLPPLQLADVLRVHRAELAQSGPIDPARLTDAILQSWPGTEIPTELPAALESAGWVRDGDRWYHPEHYQPAEPVPAPRVDHEIPRQPVRASHVPPVVRALAAAAAQGGLRVVAMPPGRAHEWTERLTAWLREELGDRRPVRLITLDRIVLDALKDSELWAYVPFQEQARVQDWSWAHAPIEAALERELCALPRGSVTVLGEPALLGTLGLTHWLSGYYERARGGRHGLIVLAVPGGVHDNRVRLNERYNLPYTPDMAAVYLDEVA